MPTPTPTPVPVREIVPLVAIAMNVNVDGQADASTGRIKAPLPSNGAVSPSKAALATVVTAVPSGTPAGQRDSDNVIMAFGKFNWPESDQIGTIMTQVLHERDRLGGDAHVRLFPSPKAEDEDVEQFKRKFPHMVQFLMPKKLTKGKLAYGGVMDTLVTINDAQKNGYKQLVCVMRPERSKWFRELAHKYNNKTAKHGFYHFSNIRVITAHAAQASV